MCPEISHIEQELLRETEIEVEYQFTAVMLEADELASKYDWTFGDGDVGEGQTVTHVFAKTSAATTYEVSVTGEVPAECDATDAVTSVDVPEIDCPEVSLSIVSQEETEDQLTVHFEVTVDGISPDQFDWDFGDGSSVTDGGATVLHTFTKQPGDPVAYTTTVTAVGPATCSTSDTSVVIVLGICPDIEDIECVEIELTDTTLEVEVQLTPTNGTPEEYVWDWGDNTTPETTTEPVYRHVYTRSDGDPDLYIVRITVKGPGHCSCLATTQIVVPGRCPSILSIDIEEETLDKLEKTIMFSLSVEGPPANQYTWNWGDGTEETITTDPAAEHTYQRPTGDAEQYEVTVTGEGPEGCGCISTRKVDVEGICPEITGYEVTLVSKDEDQQTVKINLVVEEPLPTSYRWYWQPADTVGEETTDPEAMHTFDRPVGDDVFHTIRVEAVGPDQCLSAFELDVHLEGICQQILSVPLVYGEPTEESLEVSASLVLSGPDAELYTWDWGDESEVETTTEPAATHVYARLEGETKSYTITASAVGPGCCKDSAQSTATIPGRCPVIKTPLDIEWADLDTLTQAVTVSVKTEGAAPTSYRFDWGDESEVEEGPETSRSHIYERPAGDDGRYDLTVTVEGPGDCSTAITEELVIKGRCPEVTDVVLEVVEQTASTYTVKLILTMEGPPAEAYIFDWGDGTVDDPVAEASAQHTYSRPQGPDSAYNAKIYVNGPGGCNCPVFTQIHVPGACPELGEISLEMGELTDDQQEVSAVVAVGDLLADQYIWSWGDGTVPETTTAPHASHMYFRESADAEFDLQVIAVGPGVCSSDQSVCVLIAGTCPHIERVDISYGSLSEAGQYVKFHAVIRGDEMPTQFTWDFGDNHKITTADPWTDYTYPRPMGASSQYRVTVESRGPSCGPGDECKASAFTYVKVAGDCPVITDSHAIYGEGTTTEMPVTVLVSLRGEKPDSYVWDWGDGHTEQSNQPHMTHHFVRPEVGSKQYAVKVTAMPKDKGKAKSDCLTEERINIVVTAYGANGSEESTGK